MNVTIRPALMSDTAPLYAAWQAQRQHNAALDHRILLAPVSEQDFAGAIGVIVERRGAASFVAERDGQMLGFISGAVEQNQPDRLPERHVTVGYLFIDPSARREGIGRRLVAALGDWALSQGGVSHLEMTVLAADTEAATFWRSAGFSPFIERVWKPLQGAGHE